VAGGGNVGDGEFHAVVQRIEHRADENTCIECDRLARLKVDLASGFGLNALQKRDKFVALVVCTGHVVTAAEVEPF